MILTGEAFLYVIICALGLPAYIEKRPDYAGPFEFYAIS